MDKHAQALHGYYLEQASRHILGESKADERFMRKVEEAMDIGEQYAHDYRVSVLSKIQAYSILGSTYRDTRLESAVLKAKEYK